MDADEVRVPTFDFAPRPIVHASDLHVEYGPVKAVRGVSFEIHPGHVLGVLGGNGAGKSSTLRAVGGVNPPTSGNLTIAGLDMSHPASAEQARALIGYTPDVGGLVRAATVREHIGIALASRGTLREWPAAAKLLHDFELADVVDRDTAGFSHGMSRRLSVLLAALTATRVLILDEPFDGVDPIGVQATMKVIEQAKNAGLAVLVSTHLLSLLTQCSDSIAVMVHGQIHEHAAATEFTGTVGEQRYQSILSGAA